MLNKNVLLSGFLAFLLISCFYINLTSCLKVNVNNFKLGSSGSNSAIKSLRTNTNQELFLDLTQLMTYRCSDFTGYSTPIRLNEDLDIECFSLNARDCAWDNALLDLTKCKEFIKKNLPNVKPLVCGPMHKSIYGGSGYDSSHWCSITAAKYFEKWLCSNSTGLNTGLRLKFANRPIIECLSMDGIGCTNDNDKCLKATATSIGVNYKTSKFDLKALMAKSFNDSDAFKSTKRKKFIYQEIINLPDVSPTPSDVDNISVLNIPLTTVNFPSELNFAKFRVRTPAVGVNYNFKTTNFTKEKLVLKMGDIVIGQLGKFDYDKYKNKSFEFEGIIKTVEKGPKVFSFDFYGSGSPSLMAGEAFFSIEGFY